MKVLIALFACIALCYAITLPSDSELQTLFTQWTQKYNKVYSTDEFQYRWQTWRSNALYIATHNQQNASFTVAMNQFGDLNSREFARIFNGLRRNVQPRPQLNQVVVNPSAPIPASVDWRTKGAVTHVKNQGQCGSCWSFSATGSSEGAHFLQAAQALVGLSEQNLVDCSTAEGNEGCNGGLMDDAFKYIIVNHGIDTEASYPYTSGNGESGTCQFNKANVGATLITYHDITSGSEADLTDKIAAIGPISVAIDASHSSFQFYSGGVYYEPDCSSTSLDHGVLAVGYGTSGSSAYYIVKNSWGTDWGMSGYIWMSRNRNNNCGIATMSSYPCASSSCAPSM